MTCCICNGGGYAIGGGRCEKCKGRGYITMRSSYDTERLIELSKQLANDPTNIRLQQEVKGLSEKLE
jgi:DnaJ-class molecular chaperone